MPRNSDEAPEWYDDGEYVDLDELIEQLEIEEEFLKQFDNTDDHDY